MTIGEQFGKLKENWLLIVLVLVVMVAVSGLGNIGSTFNSVAKMADTGMMESASFSGGGYMPQADFAPEVEERVITKTASMSSEVERGEFDEAEAKLKSIVKSSDSFILSENVNQRGEGWTAYEVGSFTLKIETSKYGAVLAQLKEIGEVKSFNENAQDVTGQYTNLQLNLELEQDRLQRYQDMYQEAVEVKDKLELNDRIFNQERTIKYLKDAINNIDKRVEYSTVYVTLNEKASGYAGIALAKFSSLIKALVGSFNALLYLFFAAVPWAIGIGIILLLVRLFRRRA